MGYYYFEKDGSFSYFNDDEEDDRYFLVNEYGTVLKEYDFYPEHLGNE